MTGMRAGKESDARTAAWDDFPCPECRSAATDGEDREGNEESASGHSFVTPPGATAARRWRGRLTRFSMLDRSLHVWWRCCDFHLFSVQIGRQMWRWELG